MYFECFKHGAEIGNARSLFTFNDGASLTRRTARIAVRSWQLPQRCLRHLPASPATPSARSHSRSTAPSPGSQAAVASCALCKALPPAELSVPIAPLTPSRVPCV